MPIIKVIIPAFNEQDSIANVVNDIPKIVDEVIVNTIHTERDGHSYEHDPKQSYPPNICMHDP